MLPEMHIDSIMSGFEAKLGTSLQVTFGTSDNYINRYSIAALKYSFHHHACQYVIAFTATIVMLLLFLLIKVYHGRTLLSDESNTLCALI